MSDDESFLPEAAQDISIFDKEDPAAIVNMVWPTLRDALLNWKDEDNYLWAMHGSELIKVLRPDATLSLIRIRFWEEVHFALRRNKRVYLQAVTRGVVTRDYWGQVIQPSPRAIVYVLTPPIGYKVRAQALLDVWMQRMGEILSDPSEDQRTRQLQFKIGEFILPIVKGPVVQKLQIDQRVLTQNVDAADLSQIDSSLKGVTKQLKEVERVYELASVEGREEEKESGIAQEGGSLSRD